MNFNEAESGERSFNRFGIVTRCDKLLQSNLVGSMRGPLGDQFPLRWKNIPSAVFFDDKSKLGIL